MYWQNLIFTQIARVYFWSLTFCWRIGEVIFELPSTAIWQSWRTCLQFCDSFWNASTEKPVRKRSREPTKELRIYGNSSQVLIGQYSPQFKLERLQHCFRLRFGQCKVWSVTAVASDAHRLQLLPSLWAKGNKLIEKSTLLVFRLWTMWPFSCTSWLWGHCCCVWVSHRVKISQNKKAEATGWEDEAGP